MDEKGFIIRADDILGAERKKEMKKIINAYLEKHAPDGAYKTISVEFNNKTQKYDIHIERNPKQGKVPVTNIIKG